jgi:tubulin beta
MGTGDNWSKGHYTDGNFIEFILCSGAELINTTMDTIRRQVEKCDRFQGFQFSHSIEGGTGSGLGTVLMLKLRR